MFLIRWIRTLLSLPVLWLGLLLLRFKTGPSILLLTAAWRISGDAETGRAALAAVCAIRGQADALATALAWLERQPCPEFAAYAGLLAAQSGQLEAARELLARARALGDDASGIAEWTEFLIADKDGTDEELLARLYERRDLPMNLTRAVHVGRMFSALLSGDGEVARQRAERLLDVADTPEAELALWALALQSGDEERAAAHLARGQMPGPSRLFYRFLCLSAIRRDHEALQALDELRAQDAALAAKAAGEAARRAPQPLA